MASIKLVFDGSFTKVNVAQTELGFNKTYVAADNSANTGTDLSGLDYNTSYTFSLVPYNIFDISYETKTYTSNYTKPIINTVYVKSVTSSGITFGWSGSYYTVGLYVAPYSSNTYTQVGSNYSSSTTQATYSAGEYDTQYKYYLLPYNYNSVSGDIVYGTDTSAVTVGYVSSRTYSGATTESLTLNATGTFTNAYIYNYTNSTEVGTYSSAVLSDTGVSISGLSPNSSYIFNFYGINSYGKQSDTYTSLTAYTLPQVTNFSVNTSTAYTVTFDITGNWYGDSASYSVISYGTTTDYGSTKYLSSNSGSTTVTINSLSSFTTYYFKITPYNFARVAGTELTTSTTTLDAVPSALPYKLYISGSNPGNNNSNFVKYSNYWNYSNGSSSFTWGNMTISQGTTTWSLPSNLGGTNNAKMMIYDFKFKPDIAGTWKFQGSADDQMLFYLSTTELSTTYDASASGAVAYIFAANDAATGFSATASGTMSLSVTTYYARMVYVNTGGDESFSLTLGRPSSSGGTATTATVTDWSPYVRLLSPQY